MLHNRVGNLRRAINGDRRARWRACARMLLCSVSACCVASRCGTQRATSASSLDLAPTPPTRESTHGVATCECVPECGVRTPHSTLRTVESFACPPRRTRPADTVRARNRIKQLNHFLLYRKPLRAHSALARQHCACAWRWAARCRCRCRCRNETHTLIMIMNGSSGGIQAFRQARQARQASKQDDDDDNHQQGRRRRRSRRRRR